MRIRKGSIAKMSVRQRAHYARHIKTLLEDIRVLDSRTLIEYDDLVEAYQALTTRRA